MAANVLLFLFLFYLLLCQLFSLLYFASTVVGNYVSGKFGFFFCGCQWSTRRSAAKNFTFTCTSCRTSLASVASCGHEWSALPRIVVVVTGAAIWLPTGVAFINHKTITERAAASAAGPHVARLCYVCVCLCVVWESAPTRVLCSLGSKSRSQSHLPPHLTLPPPCPTLSPSLPLLSALSHCVVHWKNSCLQAISSLLFIYLCFMQLKTLDSNEPPACARSVIKIIIVIIRDIIIAIIAKTNRAGFA